MFLRKDNTLKWKWILIGAIITAVLVAFGLLGMDKILHQIIHRPECNPWIVGNGFLCAGAVMIGKIFSTKVWLFGSLGLVIAFFFYKAFTNENDFRYAFIKIKNSYAFYVFASVFSALCVTGILKYFIGRSRPMLYDALGITTFQPMIWESIYNSMPSGHSAASFAGFVMIGMLYPRIKWLTWTLAILVAVSRVYVGAHWTSDVIFGAFIGMVVADIVKWALKKINSNRNYYTNMTPNEINDEWERIADRDIKNAISSQISNAFSVFDLPITSSWNEVASKYRTLAKKHHPDTAKNKTNAMNEFTRITEAYNTLKKYFNK